MVLTGKVLLDWTWTRPYSWGRRSWTLVALLAGLIVLFLSKRFGYTSRVSNIARALDFEGVGVLLTKEDLGKDTGPLLLSIVGHVFDVSAGAQFYGPGKPYGSFARRDATRAFATGDFELDLTESIEGLSEQECSSILSWLGFYKKSTKYHFVGYVQDGIFFDIQEDGRAQRSAVFHDLMRCAHALERVEDKYEKCFARFEFKQKMHTKSCSPGISVPRRALVSDKREHFRETCICVPAEDSQGHRDLKVYPGCDPSASQCEYAGDISESEL